MLTEFPLCRAPLWRVNLLPLLRMIGYLPSLCALPTLYNGEHGATLASKGLSSHLTKVGGWSASRRRRLPGDSQVAIDHADQDGADGVDDGEIRKVANRHDRV